jgi:hypothetical protein
MSIAKADEWNDHSDSSHLSQSKYNPMDHTMDIEFQNGWVYRHYGVPPLEYERFLDAPSQGEYHAQNIKSNYVVKRIK